MAHGHDGGAVGLRDMPQAGDYPDTHTTMAVEK